MDFGIVTGFFAAMVWWEIIIFVGLFMVFSAFVFDERGSIPFIAAAIMLFVDWTGKGPIISFHSTLDSWIWILGYLLIGLIWSFFKWGRYVKYAIDRYDDEEDVRWKLKQFSNDTIAYWIIWWPFSLIGFIFEDAIDWVIHRFKGVYNLIADKMIVSALNSKKLDTNSSNLEKKVKTNLETDWRT